MSTEMASLTCVGTSTSSHPAPAGHCQQQQSQPQHEIVTNSFEMSSNLDPEIDERRANINSALAAVPDMELVNGPNPWLPAYGFQLQQHNQHFQPTQEDLRINDSALVQQGDFLETILEETSDDLQSDSDHSGTTYWLGSDSETESVIHIKANQRARDERPDCSGSESNSVVPKKRRRKSATKDRDITTTLTDEHWASPRSSRSSESSSRSSSLLQFESLERTCATVSPSGYSYDSLEYSNRSNSHFENTSPDSLEEDRDDDFHIRGERGNSGLNGTAATTNGFAKLRPYRSFESLDTCHKNDIDSRNEMTNGFSASFYSKTSNDLSAGGLKNGRGRSDFWPESDNSDDEEYEYEEDDEDDDDDEETLVNRDPSRMYRSYGDRGMSSFTEGNLATYSTSLDFGNTIDLREIGIERKRESVYDLKSGQASSTCGGLGGNSGASSQLLQRLNIAGVDDSCGVRAEGSMAGSSAFSAGLLQHRHNRCSQNERGWSGGGGGGGSATSEFNFRFTDKSRSAPSLASDFEDSGSSRGYARGSQRNPDYNPCCSSIGTVSSSSLFENYTRVTSLPVDLNICGRDETENWENDEEDLTITNDVDDVDAVIDLCTVSEEKMADEAPVNLENQDSGSPKAKRCARTSSVRTQVRPEVIEVKTEVLRVCHDDDDLAKMHLDMRAIDASSEEADDEQESQSNSEILALPRESPPKMTVKTQDRGNNVLEMAMAMENDIDAVVDEAIRQFKREVDEAGGAIAAMETMQRLAGLKQRRRVKNNASYELAQQFEINENDIRETVARMSCCLEDDVENPGSPGSPRRRVLNNASYELAQQSDYIKMLQNRAFQRMNTCDERPEIPRPETIPCAPKVADLVRECHPEERFSGKSTLERPDIPAKSRRSPEAVDQQDSFLGQIKKNSDPFSLYGESCRGAAMGSTLGSGDEEDEEIDYRCLETKPIIQETKKYTKKTRNSTNSRSSDDENDDNFEIRNNEAVANRGMSFLGDFYPETKSHLARGENSQVIMDETFEDAGARRWSGESGKSVGRSEEKPRERSESEVLLRRSDRDGEGGAAGEDSIEPAARQHSLAAGSVAMVVVVEEAEEEEAPSVAGKEKEAKSRKERAGDSNPNGITLVSSVHTAADAPSRVSVRPAIGEKSVKDHKRVDSATKISERISVWTDDEKSARLEGKIGDEEDEEGAEVIETEVEKSKNVKTEMSATAAKRLAMASSPPRNNAIDRGQIVVGKTDSLGQRKILEPINPGNERKKGGLGGFLQRFSRLRFSGRAKVPRSEVTKKMCPESASVHAADNKRSKGVADSIDHRAATTGRTKEPDYIIIPLHAPDDQSQIIDDVDAAEARYKPRSCDLERSASCASPNGRPPVSSKPPLPPSHQQCGGARNVGATSTPTPGTRCSGSAGVAGGTRRRAATDLGSPAAIEMAKARAMQAAQEPRPVGLLETDLDAAEPAIRYVNNAVNGASPIGHPPSPSSQLPTSNNNNQAGKKTRSLLNLNHTSGRQGGRDVNNHHHHHHHTHHHHHHNLGNENELRIPHSPGTGNRTSSDDHRNSVGSCINQRPHKSMEFLLDKENLHFVKPPENELQKVGERVPSEHELRVQRSLQRLNVPDWYKNSPAARDGFRLKRHSDASQHGGWRALGSKTTSLSSLTSSSNRPPTTGVLLSPSPTPPVFSRWSTSLLNSAGSSPASSARSSFNHRQPYLGWRSQERLANPRTPAERLAQGILPQLQSTKKQQQQQQTNQQQEVRNSIKEVTSAIVHYVQSGQEVAAGSGRLSPRPRPDDWDDRGGARSTSPRGSVKLCWMESSFVGTRPVDSPETPMSLATDTEGCAGCNANGTESCSCVDSATSALNLDLTPTRDEPQQRRSAGTQHGSRSLCPSPSSTANYHQQIQQHYHHVHHQQQQQQQQRHHRGSGQSEDEEAMATAALLRNKPSPGSTTLEDVLDSLLGLPSASRTPSPGPGPISGSSSMRHHRTSNSGSPAAHQPTSSKAGKSCSDLRQDLQESARGNPASPKDASRPVTSPSYPGELVRRKSEGSDIVPPNRSSSRASNLRNRRVSFDNAQCEIGAALVTGTAVTASGGQLSEKLVRCRNNKCNNATTVAEARRVYKSCHNCTCLYCSRECRRAHWQRHRRTCLHSRAGTLCRQVLSSAKEDPSTLKHISALAQRGYASHGRGAVKCFFSSPEIAEQFVSNGFVDLGEPIYVKWSELLPSEMGSDLYAELIRLCKSYNPETRLVLYVAVCVVSEVPSSGAVRWERQLVSRCGKIRLDASTRQLVVPPPSTTAVTSPTARTASPCNITREMDSPETLVLTSMPGRDGQNTPRSSREIGFTNIQRQLRLRGVSLRRHFPQVYTKLCSYVDGSVDKFAPVTIYPRDQASGKSFMCIIMLDAEPERLQLLPTDSSRVRTVDISVEQE